MLAGCSSLLSPRHRLRSEASPQFQACHFQLPSMTTQNLNLPCTFSRKDASLSQAIRPVGLSVEKPAEAQPRVKQNNRLQLSANAAARPALLERGGRSLKRFADQGPSDGPCPTQVKRIRGTSHNERSGEPSDADGGCGQGRPGGGGLWIPFTSTWEEEKTCFAAGELASPPPPSSQSPWRWAEMTEVGEKDAETSQEPPRSSPSSQSHSSTHNNLFEKGSVHETGNGSTAAPLPSQGLGAYADDGEGEQQQEEFEIITLLLGCVEAIASKNAAYINHSMAKLGGLASPRGPSPIRRLAAYFTEALALRVARMWSYLFHVLAPREMDRPDAGDGKALRMLNQVSPIPKFTHFTSNEILLRAFEGKDRVHIIDFDIKQGLQWPSLFQSLASRAHPPSHVRITGVGESKQELNETGDRLAGFAAALNLSFEFHPVVDRLEDVRLWMLHVKDGETVAVNCAFQLHKTLHDGNGGALREFLGLIRSTKPSIVILAEQEAEHDEPCLESRVCNSLKYYAALFDSLDSCLPSDSPGRARIEESWGREIRDIVGCEGGERVERHRGFEKWRKEMEAAGFGCVGIRGRERLQCQMLLRMYSSSGNHRVEEKRVGGAAAALTLCWLDQPLYTVSGWAPVDMAGSSSIFCEG